MIQLDEVPPFKGDESPEEAERWLKTLIIATGSFSNSGILRFLHTRLKENSPAMDWYDGLDEDSKTSWIRFRPLFRQRWIQSSAHHDEWHAFCNHILTCADLFQGGRDSDLATLSDRVTIWANDHLELGKAVNRTDSALIEASRRLVPDFVDAYLQVYTQTSSTTTFYDYCDAIKSIPQTVLQMEQIRFRQSSNNWQTAMEKKITDISSKIDQLLSLRDEIASISAKLSNHSMGNPALAMQGSSSTGVAWEACSPFTSMMSLENNSDQDATGAATPVAPQPSLESTQGTE
ncbi:hypothetical protein FRC02_006398 [Tulasnella sp. 418]|nr:hypothetical protein FRC02_006398 [Tulasnella sp. 418]